MKLGALTHDAVCPNRPAVPQANPLHHGEPHARPFEGVRLVKSLEYFEHTGCFRHIEAYTIIRNGKYDHPPLPLGCHRNRRRLSRAGKLDRIAHQVYDTWRTSARSPVAVPKGAT